MKQDLVWYGKTLLIVLAPGVIFFLLVGDGSAENTLPFAGFYLALAAYLIVFGLVMIGMRYLVQKVRYWIKHSSRS